MTLLHRASKKRTTEQRGLDEGFDFMAQRDHSDATEMQQTKRPPKVGGDRRKTLGPEQIKLIDNN